MCFDFSSLYRIILFFFRCFFIKAYKISILQMSAIAYSLGTYEAAHLNMKSNTREEKNLLQR